MESGWPFMSCQRAAASPAFGICTYSGTGSLGPRSQCSAKFSSSALGAPAQQQVDRIHSVLNCVLQLRKFSSAKKIYGVFAALLFLLIAGSTT
eukprot:2795602-Rhodomonas_salina.1